MGRKTRLKRKGSLWMRRSLAVVLGALAFSGLSVIPSGCGVEIGLDTAVERDGSGVVGVRVAVDRELQDALSQAAAGLGDIADIGSFFEQVEDKIPQNADLFFEWILGRIPTDWSVDYGTDDDGTRWIRLLHGFEDLDELETLSGGRVMSMFFEAGPVSASQDEGFFSTQTRFSATAGMGSLVEDVEERRGSLPMEILGEVLSVENRLTLPGVIKDNNADHVVGSTLVWDVGASGHREMWAESTCYDWVHICIVVLAAVAGLVVAASILFFVIRGVRRRRRTNLSPASIPPPPSPPDVGEEPRPSLSSVEPGSGDGGDAGSGQSGQS